MVLPTLVITKGLAFCFVVHKEFDLAIRLVNQIKFFYPDSETICIADGTNNLGFQEFCEQREIKYFQGERLYLKQFGGAWLRRLFQTYIDNSNSEYLIKVDPDSYFNRNFNYFPDTDLGGTLQAATHVPFYLQGGCRFHTRKACAKILDSLYLEDDKYKLETRFSFTRFQYPYLSNCEEFDPNWNSSEATILSDVASRLDLSVSNWEEVYCRGREFCPTPEKYAVIHPVKEC